MAEQPAHAGPGLIPPLAAAPGSAPVSSCPSKPRGRVNRSSGWLLALDLPVLAVGLGVAILAADHTLHLGVIGRVRPPIWPLALLLIPTSLALALVFGLYRPGILRSRRRQASAAARALVWSAALSVGAVFLLAEEFPPGLRELIIAYHIAFGVWAVGARPLIATALRARLNLGEGRVLILGGGSSARDLAQGLTRRSRGRTQVVGFVDDRPAEVRGLTPFRVVELPELSDTAERLQVDLLVVARKDLPREEIIRLSDAMLLRGIRVKVLSDVFDRLFESVPFETVHGLQLLQVGETPLRGAGLKVKRGIDVFGAIVGGILILPLLTLIALAIRLGSPGTIFYLQTRIGRDGRPFKMYKFRSMVEHQDDRDHERYLAEFVKNGASASIDVRGKRVYKMVDDPRITRVGSLLRRTSLDELPQLWNVLRGEMSLVGPRPCLPFEYDLYEGWQRRRLVVTPGMTGLWQVTGRSYVTFEDMVLLDLFYIGNWSLALDAKLLFRTVPVILFGKGGL